MLSQLDHKLWRDLRRMKGQAIAVALVMACGLAMMIMARSLIYSLDSTRQEYYQAHRFAEIFSLLKRAPNSVAARIAQIPGVAGVEPIISVQATLDIAGLDEPASGNVRSLPENGLPELNRLFLRTGHWLNPGAKDEVLVSEAFADANRLKPGDTIAMLLNGKRRELSIAGLVLSPEFIFESRPGAALPDNRTYGIFWMPYKEVASAFDLDGAFNCVSLALGPGASERSVIEELDRVLKQYGGRGAYGRSDHPSHIRVSDEIRILHTVSIGFPVVFLSVAAFMTNAVLGRLLSLQREQIAIIKAFGFTNRQVMAHYLKFAFVIVAGGTVAGAAGGIVLGHRMVWLYHYFFRFPELHFRVDQFSFPLAFLVTAGAAVTGVLRAVQRAAELPPAEAMRPEPPATYRPALVERTGVAGLLSHTFRIAVRNIERKPVQALFTVAGLALATGILVVPSAMRDGVNYVMDFQWDLIQRQDVTLGLVEPSSEKVRHLFRQLPGVLRVEPLRYAFARLSHANIRRQLVIQGMPPEGLHSRVIDRANKRVPLPEEGLVVSTKLAQILGARVGDDVLIDVLEGKRLTRTVRLVGLADDFTGMAAYMNIHALNRLLGEGDVISGASFSVDGARKGQFLRALKAIPRVSSVAIKESLRENFRQTTAASIGVIQKIYMTFAMIVAFGVVYNNARISLAERARELATLRVIGFSRREVGTVLVTELVILGLIALPIGLVLGTGFSKAILSAVNTETIRLPLILTSANYSLAVLVVCVASLLSSLVVLRKLGQLDLVGALKAPE